MLNNSPKSDDDDDGAQVRDTQTMFEEKEPEKNGAMVLRALKAERSKPRVK